MSYMKRLGNIRTAVIKDNSIRFFCLRNTKIFIFCNCFCLSQNSIISQG